MPLYDVGYRAWKGAKTSPPVRLLAIAAVGIRVAFRSTWLSRTLVVSWVPALAAAALFLAYEQSVTHRELRELGQGILANAGYPPNIVQLAMSEPESVRHEVWSVILLVFFRHPQSIVMLVVIGIVAPRLISYDLRNRGYLLYFSRPIRIWEYILGKSLVVWTFVALITTLPALFVYLLGLALSSDVTVVTLTWDLPLRILGASLALMIPTTAVALACSAITIESRYATFAWFALWIVGWVSYSVLYAGEFAVSASRLERPRRGDMRVGDMPGEGLERFADTLSRWEFFSPYHVLGRVQQWIFGLFPEGHSIVPYLAVVIAVTLIATGIIHWQLRKRLTA